MNDDDTYTDDSPPDTPDPYDDEAPADDDERAYGPHRARYHCDEDPPTPYPDPRAMDRAADAALDAWLDARERAYEWRTRG